MTGYCKDCLYLRRLVHNHIPGEGWDYSGHCCIKHAIGGGPVYETETEQSCEHFAQKETVTMNLYNQRELHQNCTVEVLRNTYTGQVSYGWWDNDNPPETVRLPLRGSNGK